MKKCRKWLKQSVSFLLSVLMVANQVFPTMAYMTGKNGLKTVAGNDGQTITEEEDWITRFPNGVFALKDNTIQISEGGNETKITVYRLGGREGTATAGIALIPAVAAMDEDGEYYNYANAAGALDFRIRVEDPIGAVEEAETASSSNSAKSTVTESSSNSAKRTVTYTELEPDEENPYDPVFVDLEFADGEWVKDILISAVDDEEHEPEEFLLVMIYDASGAEFNDSANRTTVCISDNEEALDSVMGFKAESVRVDKAEGTAVITLVRTGGIQYVSQVDYYTEDGTAVAGRDYVKSEGSVGFANGLDRTELTIDLIDDGIVSTDEENDVTFSVCLSNPKAGTIDEAASVLTVSLYNSCTSTSRNLATMTYMAEAVDVSSDIQVSDTSIAEIAGNETVTADAVEEEKEEVKAKSAVPTLGEAINPKARTFTYTEPMEFGANEGSWKQWAVIAGKDYLADTANYDNVNGYASKSSVLGNNQTGSSWFWRYGNTVGTSQDRNRTYLKYDDGSWYMSTDNTIQVSLNVANLYDMYDQMAYNMTFESDKSGTGSKHNATYGYVGSYTSRNAGEYSDNYGDGSGGANSYINNQLSDSHIAFNNDGTAKSSSASSAEHAFILGRCAGNNGYNNVSGTINLKAAADSGVKSYSDLSKMNYLYFMVETSADRDIHGSVRINSAALRRQAFNTNSVLRIHTADDVMLADMAANGNEEQQKAANMLINQKLAPSVSISNGGTNSSGNLYIGSELLIRENTASGIYRFHDKIRLMETDGYRVVNSASVSTDSTNIASGTISLLKADERTEKSTSLVVDVPLDRKQSVLFSYGNSIDTDNDGIKTEEEKAAVLLDLEEKLADATMICGTYDDSLTEGTHKYYKDVEYKVSDCLSLNETNERYQAASISNLKSINFHMDPDDVILFNGQMYAGDEDIPITMGELELTTLDFQFYDYACLGLIRNMSISSIASVGLYVDYNQNGKLDIRYNEVTRMYETVEVGGKEDLFIQALVADRYTASEMEPVIIDGEIYEQMVFVRYNMAPRCLRVPPGAEGDETCQIIPNFTTIVTNEEANAKQSKEMRGYRAIDGGDSMNQLIYTEKASVGYVAFATGGDYSPAEYVEKAGGYEVKWEPYWHGSLLKEYENPETIRLDNTMMPQDGFEAATTTDQINAYLGSMHGNDTYALTIHYNNEIQDTCLGTFELQPEMGSFSMNQDAMEEIGADLTGKDTGKASNLSDSDPKIKLPNLNLGVGPATLIMDGDMVGFSIGVPLYSKKTETTYVEKGSLLPNSVETPKIEKVSETKTSNTITMAKDAINDYKEATGLQGTNDLLKQLREAANRGEDVSDQGKNGKSRAVQTTGTYGTNYVKPTGKKSEKGFNVAINMTFLWKYSNISNKFEFNQAAILLAVGGQVKQTVYPDPVHIVYVFIAFGADVEVATGLEMEEYVKADGSRGSKVIFQGVSISPSMYIEAGGGVGVELANVELYLKFSIALSASFGTPDANVSFDKFVTTGAVGLRITLLFLNYQMDLVGYETGYDKESNGWFFRWHALGENFGGSTYSLRRSQEEIEEEYAANGMRILWPEDLEYEQTFYGPDDNLPNPRLRSFTIPEVPFEVGGYSTSVSAYKLTESLGSGSKYQLLTWVDASEVSHNYLLYMIQLTKSENNDHGMQNSTLVLSELVSTSRDGNTGLGVAHPFGENSTDPYVIVDIDEDGTTDATGDLDFSAYVDEDGKLSVTWVSYREDGILTATSSNAAAQMSRNTVVKHTVIDLADPNAEQNRTAQEVYGWTEGAGYRFQPAAVDEKVTVFAEAEHYNDAELEDLKEDYDEYFEVENNGDAADATEGTGNPHAAANAQINYDVDRIYGKYSTLNISVATASDAEPHATTTRFDMGDSWNENHTRIDQIVMTPGKVDGTYYLAFSATGTLLNESNDEKRMVKQLFLQKLTLDENDVPQLGDLYLLRTLVDSDKDSSVDGVYEDSSQVEPFENPYFTNLNFLSGALSVDGNQDPVVENFFLFGMNGNTYVLDEESLDALLENGTGTMKIKPFFKPKTFVNEDGETVQEADVRSDVVIGADGDGNIAAVYTDTVPDTVNNALYICKYDPTIEGWGAPVMLAMNHMQVYEESKKKGWDHETTRANYFLEESGGDMDQFIFDSPSIALGQKTVEEQKDEEGNVTTEAKDAELLIVTRGTLTELTNAYYTNSAGEPVTEIVPAMRDGYLAAKTGYYAIAYGIGNQNISEASLTFDYNNFTEGALLTPYIRFRNTGDTAIRGSEQQPITIKLMAAKVTQNDAGEPIAEEPVELERWEVKENILAGAEFDSRAALGRELPPTADALPKGIEDMTLYFTISEDSSYVENAFGWSSLSEAGGNGTSWYKVGKKPELSFGTLTVGAEGHTTLVGRMGRSAGQTVETYVDMVIRNTGTKEAEGLKILVEYCNSKEEDGTQIWEPVDTTVTGSELIAGNEWKLEMPTTKARSGPDGIFHLVKADGTPVTTLSAGHAVNISGTMSLPAEYYDENDSTKSMNLRFTVLCDDEEYTTSNNSLYRSMEAVSLFDVPRSMNLTLGNPVEIPVNIRTTRQGIEPSVTVREISGAGGNESESILSRLHYNAETSMLTMEPGSSGSGIVRIADINTGSFTDITFVVNREGVNIVTTNPALTFENGDGVWEDKQYYLAMTEALPYLSDTAVGKNEGSFTFSTFADNIDLYFKGTITVSIEGNDFGYMETEYASDNYLNPVLINFKNHALAECEVKVTVKGDEAEFDRYVEFYGARGLDSDINLDDVINKKKDTADPIIIYGKSVPADNSVSKDAVIEFPIYFFDNTGIQAATVDGTSMDRALAGGKGAEKVLNISGNTAYYTLRVRDSAGRQVEEQLSGMWFAADGSLTEESWPHYTAMVESSDPRVPKLVVTPDTGESVKHVEISMLDLSDSQEIKEIAVADSEDPNSGLGTAGGSISLKENGLYLIRITNIKDLVQTIPVWVTEVPEAEIQTVLKRQSDEDKLYYSVQHTGGGKASFTLYGSADDSVDNSDEVILGPKECEGSVSGLADIPETRYPYYILKAVPENGTEEDAVYSVICELAKLTEIRFNQENLIWRTSFSPDIFDYAVRVPRYDDEGNPYEISSTVITGVRTATESENAVVEITQASDSLDQRTATVTVTEGGVSRTYTIHFVEDGCSCSLRTVTVKNETEWEIGENEEELRIPLTIATDRSECGLTEHNEEALKYRIEIERGAENAAVDGDALVLKNQGEVVFRVTVWNSNIQAVTSDPVTFRITRKCSVTVEEPHGGSVDVREAHLEQGEIFTSHANADSGFRFLGWKEAGAEGYLSTDPDLTVNVEQSMKLTAEFLDIELPTGTIVAETNSFRDFLHTITFGLAFPDTLEVEIQAQDNDCIPNVEYYIQTGEAGETELAALTMEELNQVTWIRKSRVNLDPDIRCVVYARITDDAGNSVIINSEGLTVDATAPVIEVTSRSERKRVTYFMTFRITDAGSGIQTAEYRLKDTDSMKTLALTGDEAKIQITSLGTWNLTIRVVDLAGNETTYTETLYIAGRGESSTESGQSSTHDYVNSEILRRMDGTPAANMWVLVDGSWYYAGADGHAVTGWLLDPNSHLWYFLGNDGAMRTGWHLDAQDGFWYYLNPENGDMMVGWQVVGGKSYYLNPLAPEPTWYLENGIWVFSGTKARPYGSMYVDEITPDGKMVGKDGALISSD